jgi:uncharacterized protein (UPF0332 family)
MTALASTLLETAEVLARRTRRPRQADLRRSVSTAYYALFHALAAESADRLVGTGGRSLPAWSRVYRALDHGRAKQAVEGLGRRQETGHALASFCLVFAKLQEERHRADYDPDSRYRREEVLGWIGRARGAVVALRRSERDERLELVTRCLFRERP